MAFRFSLIICPTVKYIASFVCTIPHLEKAFNMNSKKALDAFKTNVYNIESTFKMNVQKER